MEKKSITLLVIESATDNGLSPIQLQKSLFIIGQSQLPDLPGDFYNFQPYNYGPFCEEVYQDADALAEEGLVFHLPISGQSWCKYVITPKGHNKAEEIKKSINGKLGKYIQETVGWVSSLKFDELLRAIYAKYPDYSINSVFQG